MASIKPLGDNVLIKRSEVQGKTAGGILLPEGSKELPMRGSVVAVGEGVTRLGPSPRKGQEVLFAAHRGVEVEHEGETFLLLREDFLLGLIA